MGKSLKDSVSGALSAVKTPELKKKGLGKRKKRPSTSDSQQKNVRFDCNAAEKDHVKYVTTPFLSSVKKEKAKMNNSVEKSKNTKKLSFDEEKTEQLEGKNKNKRKMTLSEGNINKSEGSIKKKKKLSLDKGQTNESEEGSENNQNLPPGEGKTNKSGGKNKSKRKPSPAEEGTSAVEKIIPKKCKFDSEKGKTSDNAIDKESQGAGKKETKSKIEPQRSEGTLQNSATAPDAADPVNEKECTIFVGNLPLTYDHKKIVKIFNKFGPIASARVRCVPVASANVPKKATAITKKFNPKRNSANAYVVFKSKESVQKALAENGMVVDGHHLRIDNAKAKKKDSKKSIFVGGLPFDVEDDDLWEAFKDCGEIEDVRIVRDNVIGMGKGFGYVNFKSVASVELALKLNGHEIKNRKINVQRCVKKEKGHGKLASFKTKGMNNKPKLAVPKGGKALSGDDFQGRTAEQKKKKKKNKKSADTLRKNKMKKILGSPPKKSKKNKPKSSKPN